METIRLLKEQSIVIVSAELAETSVPYSSLGFDAPICLVLGNERRGVREELLELSDMVVHVPVLGMCNSLNVAIVGGIICGHLLGMVSYDTINF